jgi:hypothetical protein
MEKSIRVVPLKVTGVNNVSEIIFFNDRLELNADDSHVFYYKTFAQKPPFNLRYVIRDFLRWRRPERYLGERAWSSDVLHKDVGPRYY